MENNQAQYEQLQAERAELHAWLVQHIKYFNDKTTFHLVDPDEYFEKLVLQVTLDKRIAKLKETIYN